MSIGASVRRLFGPFERQIAEAYRSIYVDLDDFAGQLPAALPEVRTILEAGCGEGALTERLHVLFPHAQITAIDITPRIGRLFKNATAHVEFRQMTIEEIASAQPQAFDLVVMCDVLHHVPPDQRLALLAEIRSAIRPGGCFAVKDWGRSATPIHWMCYASDRYLTGDHVEFFTPHELQDLLSDVFGAARVCAGGFIRPWRNNMSFLVRV